MPWSAFLHAGGFGFGDVLVVGLVLQFPAKILDGFIQPFFQWYLQTHKHALKEDHGQAPLLLSHNRQNLGGGGRCSCMRLGVGVIGPPPRGAH